MRRVLTAAASALCLAGPARASLIGDEVNGYYGEVPGFNFFTGDADLATAEVGSGTEFSGIGNTIIDIDAATVTVGIEGFFAASAPSRFELTDLDPSSDQVITGAFFTSNDFDSLNPTLSFTADSVTVSLPGFAAVPTNRRATIALEFGPAAVPEPTSLALLGVAGVGALAARRLPRNAG